MQPLASPVPQRGDLLSMWPALAPFWKLVQQSLDDDSFVRLVLANPRSPEEALERVTIRRLALRGVDSLSLQYRYRTRDQTHNHPLAEAGSVVLALLSQQFRNANLFTQTAEHQLLTSRKGKVTVRSSQQTRLSAPVTERHDRDKQYPVAVDRPFLRDLGITDERQHVIPAMARKWKQINHFIEVFRPAFAQSALAEASRVRVVDFGSGKGYLTFALHDYLSRQPGRQVQVTGVELRGELVQFCSQVVARQELQGLHFHQGDVRDYAPDAMDVVIALHACDTATDVAIHLGIRQQAAIILCAPCCHKQIRPQLHSPQVLKPLLQHGVHLGQEAEMVTDGLRALLLEACGYETRVFEFVSLEHTSKNKMILAVRRAQAGAAEPVLAQIAAIKQFYGIREHCLELLLREDGLIKTD